MQLNIRDRPFILKGKGGGGGVMVFCFVQKFFFGQHKSQNIYFCGRAKREFFFQNLTLGYMTKTLNQIIFFSSIKIRIFFSATLGIRIFFQKKTITPPFKLNGRSLRGFIFPDEYPNERVCGACQSGKTSILHLIAGHYCGI